MRVKTAIAIALYIVVELVLVGGFPLWAVLALLTDIPRRSKLVTLRLICFAIVYLGSQLSALLRALVIWIRFRSNRQRYMDENYSLQRWWSNALFSSMCWLFNLRFEVQGQELLAQGPYLFFVQHTSIVDTLIPSAFAANPFGVHMRYIMKSELRADPALDIMTNRIPNYFVNRRSTDTAAELANIRTLACDLGSRDAVAIWPEGTRWTLSKWRHVIQSMREKSSDRTFPVLICLPGLTSCAAALVARAEAMQHVMPPRVGGVLALLEGAPAADVVFCAHHGLEGFATVNDIFSGGLVGSNVRCGDAGLVLVLFC
jgi:1-acyl-sn-glycerol-3-phosphate acyltransferase